MSELVYVGNAIDIGDTGGDDIHLHITPKSGGVREVGQW